MKMKANMKNCSLHSVDWLEFVKRFEKAWLKTRRKAHCRSYYIPMSFALCCKTLRIRYTQPISTVRHWIMLIEVGGELQVHLCKFERIENDRWRYFFEWLCSWDLQNRTKARSGEHFSMDWKNGTRIVFYCESSYFEYRIMFLVAIFEQGLLYIYKGVVEGCYMVSINLLQNLVKWLILSELYLWQRQELQLI